MRAAPVWAAVAALDQGGVIGAEGALPWHLPADLARFKSLTLGCAIVMGRTTFESIGRPLPGRTNIVLSRNPHFEADGCLVCSSLDEAEHAAQNAAPERDIMLIGGQQLYQLGLDRCTKLYLTHVHTRLQGDAYFPELRPDQWCLTRSQNMTADGRHAFAMTFSDYERQS